MGKIIAEVDDAGRVQVKVLSDPKSGRFFTKRDCDNTVRSIKKEYRRSIKEHRRQKMVTELKGQENGN